MQGDGSGIDAMGNPLAPYHLGAQQLPAFFVTNQIYPNRFGPGVGVSPGSAFDGYLNRLESESVRFFKRQPGAGDFEIEYLENGGAGNTLQSGLLAADVVRCGPNRPDWPAVPAESRFFGR